jgi:glycerol-3-phosphate dehydrogenase (NAD(P)+)
VNANDLAIVGGGAWGTALACVLASRFDSVRLWIYEPDVAEQTGRMRVNHLYLPGVRLPENVRVENAFEAVLSGAPIVLSVMPSHVVRVLYSAMLPFIQPGAILVSATKGLEAGSLLRVSQVIGEVAGASHPVAVLTGPSFAREVAMGSPTALVAASAEPGAAALVQQKFSGPTFRVYASDDPAGAELGGALKNVIAIGAGICDGLSLGHNAVAALITRGLAELTRLAAAMGGKSETLAGLAGLGDLVLTCTGDLSRNRQVGLKLASGMQLPEILASTASVAEGVKTTATAVELARRHSVEMPIAEEMNAVLNQGRAPEEAIKRLMTRSLRAERG